MKRTLGGIIGGLILFGVASLVSRLLILTSYPSIPGAPISKGFLLTTSVCSSVLSIGQVCTKIWPTIIADLIIFLLFCALVYVVQSSAHFVRWILILFILAIGIGVSTKQINYKLSSGGFFTPYFKTLNQ